MKTLKREVNKIVNGLTDKEYSELQRYLNSSKLRLPFGSETQYILNYLMANQIISLDDHIKLTNDYQKRNKFAKIFESSNHDMGKRVLIDFVMHIVPELKIASKKYDKSFNQDYTFFYSGIRICFGTARALDKNNTNAPIWERGVRYGEKKSWAMNFQRIHPDRGDVYVWMGIWRDKCKFWVLAKPELWMLPLARQTRESTEKQFTLSPNRLQEFSINYEVGKKQLLEGIIDAYNTWN